MGTRGRAALQEPKWAIQRPDGWVLTYKLHGLATIARYLAVLHHCHQGNGRGVHAGSAHDPQKCWRRLYRKGYRVVKVKVVRA